MTQILRTVLIPDEAQAADGTPQWDLPVNPLSAILLTVQALNENVALNTYSAIAALLAMVPDVKITYRGASVVQGSLQDLALLGSILHGWGPIQLNKTSTDNDVRAITVPILFGRFPYDDKECFPATRRGDLILQLTTDIAVAGADGLSIQAETIELLEAKPERFCKVTTTNKVHNAVSEHDIELPIGNPLLGALLFSPVVPTGAVRTASFGSLALEIDNVETVFAESRWESMRADLIRRLGAWPERPHTHGLGQHTHTLNAAAGIFPLDAADTALSSVGGVLTIDGAADPVITGINAATGQTNEQEEDASIIDNYAYLDFDPTRDGKYQFETKGAARVNLRVNCEVASATAVRVLPIELVPIQGAGGAA